jgi:hypothetical protein
MLARLANKAASMYAELETDELRNEVARLERELSIAASGARTPSA